MNGFWSGSKYFSSPPISLEMVFEAERALGFKLPASYLELLNSQNGGTPTNLCFPTQVPTSWANDHICISNIRGIGGDWGIDSSTMGSQFMIQEWGYPTIGVIICDCPSAGHDSVMLDYSHCGDSGEPSVVHVDVESNPPTITELAPTFTDFINGLKHEDEFPLA